MKKTKAIVVQGSEIKVFTQGEAEYINLTDMARGFEGEAGEYIRNWLRNGSTIQFLGVWEKVHNPNFNLVEFHQIKSEVIDNRFIMSAKKWISRTNAIGISAKAGRYGGTYAHTEIALQFATWLSPEFYVYLIKEFNQIKIKGATAEKPLEWTVRRIISSANYRLHTEAVKQHLLPPRLEKRKQGSIYANEADILNLALFGMTAKQWKATNPTTKGNMRDHASIEQLLVLSNLETLNAQFIKDGLHFDERLEKLNDAAIYQMHLLINHPSLKKLT